MILNIGKPPEVIRGYGYPTPQSREVKTQEVGAKCKVKSPRPG